MNKSGFDLDFKDFDKKFSKIVKDTIPGLAGKGLRQAGQEWKLDADNIAPRTPHLEGFLRGSGKVSDVKVGSSEISISVSYDKPYAARWHEAEPGTVKWSEPGVGPKYLESKAVRFKNKYMQIIADIIRRGA